MNWVKGGENQLWSVEGLPLEMTMNIEVKDLYPLQMSSSTLSNLKYNRGLLAYLENMAGVTTNQLSVRSVKTKVRAYLGQVGNRVTDIVSLRPFRMGAGNVWSSLANKFMT